MPFDYGLRLDNRQRIANAREKPIKANKNQSVDGAEGLSLRSGSPQNVYLLPQHPNFCLKRRPRPDQIDDHPNNEPDKISHHATASPDSRSTASQIGFVTGTAWQIARVRAFIDENLHRTIHAKDLSAVAERSTTHFSRSFKQAFGEPPHAYVVRRRLERACHLMITNSASLSEIALSVGFSDQAHLCRLFSQALGQSPSSWRRDLESRRG